MPPLQSFSEKHKTRKHKCRAAAPPRLGILSFPNFG